MQVDQWLKKRGATPAEAKIYKIVVKLYRKDGLPVKNGRVAEVYGTHRTNIKTHLANMIRKGMIQRHQVKQYIPIIAA